MPPSKKNKNKFWTLLQMNVSVKTNMFITLSMGGNAMHFTDVSIQIALDLLMQTC